MLQGLLSCDPTRISSVVGVSAGLLNHCLYMEAAIHSFPEIVQPSVPDLLQILVLCGNRCFKAPVTDPRRGNAGSSRTFYHLPSGPHQAV